MKLVAYSADSFSKLLGELRAIFAQCGRVTVDVNRKHRTLDQNAIGHAWYLQVSNELREDTKLGVKCFCKLHFGVPILRAEDEEFRAVYDSVIKPLEYSLKLKAMQLLPVTSRMSTEQKSEYLEAMQAHYSRRGVHLEFPLEAAA